MKFPWLPHWGGLPRPLLKCGLRRLSNTLPVDMLIIVDTGADVTTLPFDFVSMLGITTSELESSATNAVGGKTTTWKMKAAPQIDVEIGGHWYALPDVMFAEKTPPLLGRDLIFKYFKLRMENGETDLRPI